MATEPQTAEQALAGGTQALRRGAWQEARELFEAALRTEAAGGQRPDGAGLGAAGSGP